LFSFFCNFNHICGVSMLTLQHRLDRLVSMISWPLHVPGRFVICVGVLKEHPILLKLSCASGMGLGNRSPSVPGRARLLLDFAPNVFSAKFTGSGMSFGGDRDVVGREPFGGSLFNPFTMPGNTGMVSPSTIARMKTQTDRKALMCPPANRGCSPGFLLRCDFSDRQPFGIHLFSIMTADEKNRFYLLGGTIILCTDTG